MKNTLVGIIAAMDEEIEVVFKIMKEKKIKKIYELEFFEGKINQLNCVLVKCGVGKVNAARTTQILIDNYKIGCIINIGSAGSINDKLEIGDIVIGEKVIQHDFDITAFGHEKGYITDVGKIFKSDIELVNIIENISNKIKEQEGFNIKRGIIATGDIFCTSIEMKNKIRSKFEADCVEMEGGAIAQVCSLDKIPFIIIRAISDKPNGKNAQDFNEFLELATKRYAQIIKNLIL